MAGDIPNLNVEILVQLTNLTAAVQEATAGLNKIGDTAKEQESKFSSLKTTMLGVFAGNLMTQGLQILTTGLHDAIKAVEDTQVATEQLSTAMNNAKQNTAANREEVQKTTEKMSALGFSVADSETAYTKLITATGSTTESTKLMAMAADLARYKHESLADAAATLEKGTLGNAKAFKEFGITLDTTLPKNQAIAKAMDELNAKIGGQAVGYTHTFAGEMEVLKAKFDDVAVKIGAVVMPILTKLMEVIMNVIVPAIEFLYNNTIGAWLKALIDLWNTHEGLRKVVVAAIQGIIEAFGYLLGAIAKVVDTVARIPVLGAPFKAMGKGIDEAALSVGKFGASLDSLANKKITLPTLGGALASSGGTSAGGDTGVGGGLGAAGNVLKSAATAAKAHEALVKSNLDTLTKLNDQYASDLVNRQDQMDSALATRRDAEAKALQTFNQTKDDLNRKHDEAYASAQQAYDQASAAAEKTHTDAIAQIDADFAAKKADLLTQHNDNLLAIQNQYADQAVNLEKQAADKRQAIIQSSIDLMTGAFANATKVDIGSLFNTGATASDLKAALQDQLDAVVKLQKDAGLLAAQGYSQTFIDQVLAKGPEVGDQMSQAILNATPETAAQIKSLYGQIQNVSDNGLNDLAKQMNSGTTLATQQMMDQYKQVGVDLSNLLADNSSKLADAVAKENGIYDKNLDAATDSYNKAVAAADKTLTDALASEKQRFNDAQAAADQNLKDGMDTAQRALDDANAASMQAYNDQINAISAAMDDKLTKLQGQIQTTLAQLATLGVAAQQSNAYSALPGSNAGNLGNANASASDIASMNAYALAHGLPLIGTAPQVGLTDRQTERNLTINNSIYTTDPSLPSVTAGTLAAITLGQTQGVTSVSPMQSTSRGAVAI